MSRSDARTPLTSSLKLYPSVTNRDYCSINMDETTDTHLSLIPFSCKSYSRLVLRNSGRSNVTKTGVKLGYLGYFKDSFTTIINTPWYVVVAVFVLTYLFSWLFFGGIWIIVAHQVDSPNNNQTCLHGVTDFESAVLFSLETQVTIGYGNRYVDNDCTIGISILIVQCILGLMIDSVMLGLIFAKITRPRNRRKTIIFSEKAVIYEEGGKKVLQLRIGNLRRSEMAETHVRLALYWYKLIDPQSAIPEYEFQYHDLPCGYDYGTDRIILLTPVIVTHEIDDKSPLCGITSELLHTMDLEIVVILEGIVEATSLTAQALWSFTKKEIVFDSKFVPIVSREKNQWIVNFQRFNDLVPALVQPQ